MNMLCLSKDLEWNGEHMDNGHPKILKHIFKKICFRHPSGEYNLYGVLCTWPTFIFTVDKVSLQLLPIEELKLIFFTIQLFAALQNSCSIQFGWLFRGHQGRESA